MIAAIFEATLTREQVDRLAELMAEARPTRPADVLTASLLYEGDRAQLVAYWKSREHFDAYMETVDVPRGTELMRKVGAEPEMRLVECLELG